MKESNAALRKGISVILIVVLLLAAAAFFTLWQSEKRDTSAYEKMAQAGAAEAYRRFASYAEKGSDGDYWGGVAAFHTFYEAYSFLTEGRDKSANRAFCSEVYGSLLLSPERSKAHIPEIVDAMKLLSENVLDENGYVKMSELRNVLK